MTPTPLDRAAVIILDGILTQLPKLSPDRLDHLLARVSWIHRQRVAKARAQENQQKARELVVRMQSAAAHTDGAFIDPPPAKIEIRGNRTYCSTCADSRRLEQSRKHANAKRGVLGPVKSPEWRKDINEERRLAGQCQLCIKPVDGRPKQALYCARHRKLRIADAQRKHRLKTDNKHGREFYRRNRERILAEQRERRSKQHWRKRKRRNEQKRLWRQRNRDKVRAQKRRHAFRGKAAEATRRRRERLGDLARVPKNPALRNERGERLCLGDGCQTVMTGRAKMCARCKQLQSMTIPERRSA